MVFSDNDYLNTKEERMSKLLFMLILLFRGKMKKSSLAKRKDELFRLNLRYSTSIQLAAAVYDNFRAFIFFIVSCGFGWQRLARRQNRLRTQINIAKLSSLREKKIESSKISFSVTGKTCLDSFRGNVSVILCGSTMNPVDIFDMYLDVYSHYYEEQDCLTCR